MVTTIESSHKLFWIIKYHGCLYPTSFNSFWIFPPIQMGYLTIWYIIVSYCVQCLILSWLSWRLWCLCSKLGLLCFVVHSRVPCALLFIVGDFDIYIHVTVVSHVCILLWSFLVDYLTSLFLVCNYSFGAPKRLGRTLEFKIEELISYWVK